MWMTYDIEVLAAKLISILRDDDTLIFMSNGDFCGAKELLIKQLDKLHV